MTATSFLPWWGVILAGLIVVLLGTCVLLVAALRSASSQLVEIIKVIKR